MGLTLRIHQKKQQAITGMTQSRATPASPSREQPCGSALDRRSGYVLPQIRKARQQPCRPAQRPCRSDSPYIGKTNISNAAFRLNRQRFQASPFLLPKTFSHGCRLVTVCSVLHNILKKKPVIARLLFNPDSSRSQAAFPAVVPDLPKKGGPKAPAPLRESSAPSPFRWLPPGM